MSAHQFSNSHVGYIERMAQAIDGYVKITNQLLGAYAFAVVCAVFTAKHPQFWASIAWVVLVLYWGINIQEYREKFDELRYIGYEGMRPWRLLKKMLPALGGMVLLTAVASGDITQDKFFLPLTLLTPAV
ncbi:hypothetical protein BVH01_08770 [Pseudomonas sp. PA1(2017)]|uniref:hypothetical protein n=1 Tax=Pseudomonas sp. PA1(2017) TaxID=1932113 RepID=UPI000969108B|nr:hypothetical protein [Pseudomonas sp. PA1(2017)]OLU16668.1 hypothetical protein BVH01_08770 [Pseudomonas sp. PA1(2017)]